MIRIDLRYALPIIAFYVPTLMFATLGLMIGYPVSDMREALLAIGAFVGLVLSAGTILHYSAERRKPVWFYIRGRE
jgi:uncharacterized membrane protein